MNFNGNQVETMFFFVLKVDFRGEMLCSSARSPQRSAAATALEAPLGWAITLRWTHRDQAAIPGILGGSSG